MYNCRFQSWQLEALQLSSIKSVQAYRDLLSVSLHGHRYFFILTLDLKMLRDTLDDLSRVYKETWERVREKLCCERRTQLIESVPPRRLADIIIRMLHLKEFLWRTRDGFHGRLNEEERETTTTTTATGWSLGGSKFNQFSRDDVREARVRFASVGRSLFLSLSDEEKKGIAAVVLLFVVCAADRR